MSVTPVHDMATMATQYGSTLEAVPTDEDMEMLSDIGHADDIDIDIDVQGSYMGDDYQDIEYMVEDGQENPNGQEAHDDDIMIDDIEEETIIEADMDVNDTVPDEHMAAGEHNQDGLGAAAIVSDVSIENAHFVPHSPHHADELQEASTDVWHEDTSQHQNNESYTEVDAPTNASESYTNPLEINEHADVFDFAAAESVQDNLLADDNEQQKPAPGDDISAKDSSLSLHSVNEATAEPIPSTLGGEVHITALDEGHVDSDEPHPATAEDDGSAKEWHHVDEQALQEHDEEDDTLHAANPTTYGEDEYTISHPVTVEWESERYSLFPPSTEDGSETYLLQDSGLTNKKMSELFEACRQVLGDGIQDELALFIEIKELDLSINEVKFSFSL